MGYCHECGVFREIDWPTALCGPCWTAWPSRGTGRSPADNPPPASPMQVITKSAPADPWG